MSSALIGTEPIAPTRARLPRPWLLLVCLLLLVAGIYSQCIGGPFVWDDYHLIVDAPDVSHARPFLYYFGHNFWNDPSLGSGSSSYYRPITTWTLALDHRIHGDNSGGFHLTNLGLHLLNTSLLFAILRRRGAAGWAAALCTGLWTLFPRLAEAAAWVSGRTDLLAAAFVLLAFYLASYERSLLARAAAAVCVLLGLLSKEVALAAGLALLLDAWLLERDRPLLARALRLLPYVIALAAYAALRVHATGLALADGGALPLRTRSLLFLEAAGRYLWMLVDAYQPDAQIGAVAPHAWRFVALGGSALLACGAAAIWLAKRGSRPLQVAACWSGVSLFLAMHLLPTPIDVVAADRFMYLPLAGLVVMLTPALERWISLKPARAWAPGLLLASYLPATYLRVVDWSDELRFWTHFYHQHREHNTRAAVELGNVYFRGHLYSDALRIFLTADDPANGSWTLVARANAAQGLTALGRTIDARRLAEQTARAAPNVPMYAMDLGLANVANRDFDAARQNFTRALELYPGYSRAQVLRDHLPKVAELSKNLPADPKTLVDRLMRARFFAQIGRRKDALLEWQLAAETGQLSKNDWLECLLFAFQFGDPKFAAWFYEHGKSALGTLDPRLEISYRQRVDTETRLRQAWRELGLAR